MDYTKLFRFKNFALVFRDAAFGQGFKDISFPTKEPMKLVLEQKIAIADI